MARRYRSGWWLERKYHDEGWTQAEIADACSVSPRCIRDWMDRRGVETREMVGEDHPQHGSQRSERTKAKIAETMAGREISDEHRERIAAGHKGRSLPAAVRERIAESLSGRTLSRETRRRMSESTAGERNPNWKGGYGRRYGEGWSVAREFVLARDGCCQSCGREGGQRSLDVHHVIPVRWFRDATGASVAEAHDPRNLVALCRRCHPKADHGDLSFDSGIEPPE